MFGLFHKKKFYPYPIISVDHYGDCRVVNWINQQEDIISSMLSKWVVNGILDYSAGSEPGVVITICDKVYFATTYGKYATYDTYRQISGALNREITDKLADFIIQECRGTRLGVVGVNLQQANTVMKNQNIKSSKSINNIF